MLKPISGTKKQRLADTGPLAPAAKAAGFFFAAYLDRLRIHFTPRITIPEQTHTAPAWIIQTAEYPTKTDRREAAENFFSSGSLTTCLSITIYARQIFTLF